MKTIQSKLTALFCFFLILSSTTLFLTLTSGQKEAGFVINIAGRQSMLTQIASSVAQELMRSPENTGAKDEISNTLNTFEKSLESLISGNPEMSIPATTNPEILAKLKEVKVVWGKFRENINTVFNSLSEKEKIVNAIDYIANNDAELLQEINKIVGMYEARNLVSYQVNWSGKLRMLSQRIAKELLMLKMNPEDPLIRGKIEKTKGSFDSIISGLRSGNSLMNLPVLVLEDQTILSSLDELTTEWKKFKRNIERLSSVTRTTLRAQDTVTQKDNKFFSEFVEAFMKNDTEKSVSTANITSVSQHAISNGGELFSKTAVLVEAFTKSGDNVGRVISLAGELQILIHRMSKNAFALRADSGNETLQLLLEKDKSTFDDLLNGFLRGSQKHKLPATKDANIRGQLKKIIPLWDVFKKNIEIILALDPDQSAANKALDDIAKNRLPMLTVTNDVTKLFEKQNADRAGMINTFDIFAVITTFLAIIMGWLFIIVPLIKTLKRTIQSLMASSEQILNASAQTSSSSQSLAESTTEQASNIEETSSAMEEMASMTNQNSDHASSANAMVTSSRDAVRSGAKNIEQVVDAMGGIQMAFDKINKIVRAIEEIAVQTNILSLNAALEAAEAGEYGKRFAVVADEVQTLSQQAEEAASEAVELIQDAHATVLSGGEMVNKLQESFSGIEGGASQIAILVSEIEAASEEQAQGCDQVNRALVQLDQTTQRNASTAEENAASSEELSSQSIAMRDIVSDLSRLVMNEEEFTNREISTPSNIHPTIPKESVDIALPEKKLEEISAKKQPVEANDGDFQQF